MGVLCRFTANAPLCADWSAGTGRTSGRRVLDGARAERCRRVAAGSAGSRRRRRCARPRHLHGRCPRRQPRQVGTSSFSVSSFGWFVLLCHAIEFQVQGFIGHSFTVVCLPVHFAHQRIPIIDRGSHLSNCECTAGNFSVAPTLQTVKWVMTATGLRKRRDD